MATSTSTSTLFNKNIDYNRLVSKVATVNLGGPVKRRIKLNKRKERKENILSYNYNSYFYLSSILITLNLRKNEKGIDGGQKTNTFVQKSLNC